MNLEDIIRMAREAGLTVLIEHGLTGYLERFAALVAAAEREACAKVVEDYWREVHLDIAVGEIAAEIRARGQE